MATKTNIANMAMTRLGEAILSDVDTDGSNPADLVNAVWDVVLEEALYHGPELGWKFARRRYNSISRESFTITAFASASSTTTTVTATHTLQAGDDVYITGTSNYDGTFTVQSVSGTTSFVINTAYVADDATGTAYWTSDTHAYRYSRPTCTRVTSVQVGGEELTDWVREGSYILTNEEGTAIDVWYVLAPSSVTVTNFPMHFVDVLWRRLASHLAYSLTQNSRLQQSILTGLEQIYLPRAIGMDNREQYEKEQSSSWVDAGRGSSSIE